MQISNTFTENLIFRSAKANTSLETKKTYLAIYRNEPKQCTNTWKITEVSNFAKRRADNSGNHADL